MPGSTFDPGRQGQNHALELFDPRMSEREFDLFARLIHECLGIKMPPVKRSMLESRLRRRLKARGVPDYRSYLEYLHTPEGKTDELVQMIDAVTTNKTDFFREPGHFDFLADKVLPGRRGELRAWSAGCSSGEEAWSMAMVFAEHQRKDPGFSFSVLASDISTRMLEVASRGVYTADRVEPVPRELAGRYLMRSRDRTRGLVRVVPELRERAVFLRLNLMDSEYLTGPPLDIVFCRNVLIYFERYDQADIVGKILGRMVPGGFLFLGHSETIQGMGLPAVPVGPMVYRKEAR